MEWQSANGGSSPLQVSRTLPPTDTLRLVKSFQNAIMYHFTRRLAFCVIVSLSTSVLHIGIWILLSSLSLPDPYSAADVRGVPELKCECPPAEEFCGPAKDETKTLEGAGQEMDSDDRDYLEGLGILKDSKHYLLVVLVLSSVKGTERRDAIRETWKGYSNPEEEPPVLVQFVIGTLGLSSSEMEVLTREQQLHHDLVLLPGLMESYYNLTLKVLESFIWADRNLKFSYLLKCDDDSFVMLHLIAEELSERTSKRSLYWGFFDGRATPKTAGKWVEKEWFLCDKYLPYALGGGYVISADLVHKIALVADGLRLYNNEDTSMGVWLSPYKAERRHDVRFDTEFVSRGCRNSYIISHKQSVKNMHLKHSLLQTRGALCEKEFQTRMSYEYNWSEPPSKCCERKQGIP